MRDRLEKSAFLIIRGQVSRSASIVLGVLPIIAMFLLWWLFTSGPPEERRIGPAILPSPVEVAHSVPELITSRNLLHHVWASVRRVSLSFILSLCIVLPIGILMGAFGSVSALFTPVSTASGYIRSGHLPAHILHAGGDTSGRHPARTYPDCSSRFMACDAAGFRCGLDLHRSHRGCSDG